MSLSANGTWHRCAVAIAKLTVPEAAKRVGRNPETVRRWIREGEMHSTRVGTQHLIDEAELSRFVDPQDPGLELPPEWQNTSLGGPMPDVVAAVRRSRPGPLTMRLVVDASAIVPVILAGGVLGPLEPHELKAPPLLTSEVTSAVNEMAWRGIIPREHGRAALGLMTGLNIRIEQPVDLPERAWDISEALEWAKTYDAEYVALAVLHDIPLVTLDNRLRRGAKRLAETMSPLDLPLD